MKQIFCLFFFLFSTLSFAEEPVQPKQQQVEQSGNDSVFETMEAPISYKGAFVKMIGTLLGLIALIVISVWMLRRISHSRLKQMNYGRSIKVLERRPLSAKTILYLVEISGKKVVIAESHLEVRGITTADHLSPEDE